MSEDRTPQDGPAEKQKTTSLRKIAGVFNAPRKVLPGALAPYRPTFPDIHGVIIEEGRELGWVRGALPAPSHEDRYIVEFIEDGEVKVLAYLDRFGRAFAMDEPTVAPPARHPELTMVRVEDESTPEEERGCFFTWGEDEEKRVVARYRLRDGGYTLYDSWYDFGEDGENLTYEDAMTRVYIACVYRPSLTGITVPTSGLACIDSLIEVSNIIRGLRAVKLLISRAETDPALKPPPLALCFNAWLEEAGFTDRASHSWLVGYEGDEEAGPLRLVRTRRTADTFYLSRREGVQSVSAHTIWAVESALNRYLLIREAFGIRAALVDEAEIAREDARLRNTVALQAPSASHPQDIDEPEPAGEWSARVFSGTAMEKLRLPYRYEAAFHMDVAEPGIAAWMLVAPDASLMPAKRYSEDTGEWVDASEQERHAQALRYAMHVGIALAAASFASTEAIQDVMVTARPFAEAEEASPKPYYQIVFTRETFCEKEAYRQAAAGDPLQFFESFPVFRTGNGPFMEPFEAIAERPSYELRAKAPELAEGPLTLQQQDALGCRTMDGMRISHDVDLHFEGERLSEELLGTTSTQEAIKLVRGVQDQTGNPLVYQACTRLMTELTQGTVDAHDIMAVRACFSGDDPYAEALGQVRALSQADPQRAEEILRRVIDEAQRSGRYTDTAEVVHRTFDSYCSRLIYNLRNHDDGRIVELVPPTLLMCYLDAINLFDESFTDSDAAVEFGRRCIEIAPTFTLSYRRSARAFMLVGDLENARKLLVECLKVALEPDEIAMAYYQLAYVEWKAGRGRAGLACYLKSIIVSPVYAQQCSIELHELMAEEGLDVIARDDVNGILEEAGIPIAPVHSVMEHLTEAMKAAVDANLFAPARAFLSAYLTHEPDDSLTNVLHSLGDPRVEGMLDS